MWVVHSKLLGAGWGPGRSKSSQGHHLRTDRCLPEHMCFHKQHQEEKAGMGLLELSPTELAVVERD